MSNQALREPPMHDVLAFRDVSPALHWGARWWRLVERERRVAHEQFVPAEVSVLPVEDGAAVGFWKGPPPARKRAADKRAAAILAPALEDEDRDEAGTSQDEVSEEEGGGTDEGDSGNDGSSVSSSASSGAEGATSQLTEIVSACG